MEELTLNRPFGLSLYLSVGLSMKRLSALYPSLLDDDDEEKCDIIII